MNRLTFFQILCKPFLFLVFLIGSFNFVNAQSLHSAIDSATFSFTFPASSGMGVGFSFSPTQDLFIDKMGKLVPDSGAYSWVIWDAETETKIHQQNSIVNNPAQYSYEDIDSNLALILKQGNEYVLTLYLLDTVFVYLKMPPQVGQHIIYNETRVCDNCDTNTFPKNVQPGVQFGLVDFLYSLVPLKRGYNDAAVLSIDPSVVCSGMNDIFVEIGNYGFNQLDSVEIHWEFNGVPQTMVKYTQLLDTMNGANLSSDTVFLGSRNFQTGMSNAIKVWVAHPNGQTDTVIYSDTMEVVRHPQISGNFTLDPSLPAGATNYTSFSSLASDLNNNGICGPVNVTVAPGIYNDFFYLEEIIGSSSTNTVTIDGQDSSTVLLTHDGSSSFATVTLDGADHVTIKNMTIEASNSSFGSSVLFGNNSKYNNITNNVLLVDSNATVSSIVNVAFSGSPSSIAGGTVNSDFNIISNNIINGGDYGIRIYGDLSDAGINNKILNNKIFNIYSRGIYAYYQDSLEMIGNDLNVAQRTNSSNMWGLLIYNSNNTIIDGNTIYAKSFGISYYNSSPPSSPSRKIKIANNMIISDDNGVELSAIDSVEMFHNSISVLGDFPAVRFAAGSSSGSYDVRNNILSATNSYSLQVTTDTIFEKFDYNIFYSQGLNLLGVGTTSYSDLVSYQSALPQYNMHSIEGNPLFLSPSSDLHIVGALADNAGDNSVGIVLDIDGEMRPQPASSNVDIGADEYVAPTCLPVYDLQSYNPRLDSITIEWEGGLGTFQYEIVQEGNANGTGFTGISSIDSIRIGGLSASTAYDFYVRRICGGGDTSIWWGPIAFNTAYDLKYVEDFDSFGDKSPFNGWNVTTDTDPKWTFDTTSTNGALVDHTPGAGGKFMYLTATGNIIGDTSNLISPPIYIDANRKHIEFSFWYHMHGSNMGDLKVFVDTNGTSNLITTLSGQKQVNQTDPWLLFSTYLHGYEGKYIQLRFEGIEGNGWLSEMAIDDVVLDTVPPINAGVVELTTPSIPICSGTHQFTVGVKNIGSTVIDSVEVFCELNGVLIDSSMHPNTILPGDTAVVSVGSATFNNTLFYDLRFFTRNPNSIADPINIDDTLVFSNFRTGLSGNYTIDTALPASINNFKSFVSAIEALATYGVCGPVNITVANGTYYESLILKEISGADMNNTITFDGLDSSLTILSHDGSLGFATITFDGADYITFKNMTIEATNTTGAATVLFANAAEHNTIMHNDLKITALSSNSNSSNVVLSGSISSVSTGADANYNTIANNKISGGYYGIYVYGSSTYVNNQNKIIGNKISDVYDRGIYVSHQDSVEIVGNKIDVSNALGNGSGIYITASNNTLLLGNNILAKKYGVYYSNYNTYSARNRNIRIANNMIVSKDIGLNITVVSYVDLFHNSIHVSQGGNAAVQLLGSGVIQILDYDVRNNIFSSHSGSALETNSPIALLDLDYNIYYSTASVLVSFDNINYSDLIAFQTAYPSLNMNSLEGSPQFGSPTDLHVYGSFANDVGDNSVGITEDVDGEVRPMPGSTIVDIGADEFDPPSCPPVVNPMAINPTPNSIDLKWIGGLGSFQYEIVYDGDTLGSGQRAITTLDSLSVGGLDQNTSYEYYVREICGRGDTSIWWGPIGFVTTDSVVDFALVSFQGPTVKTTSCYTNTEAVEVFLKNLGNVAMDFVKDTATVSVSVSGAVNQNLSIGLTDNSLNNGLPLEIGDSILVPVGSIGMANIGNYQFVGIVSTELDNLSSNDSIFTQLVNAASGGIVSVSSDTICGSAMVNLNTTGSQGGIQWQRLVSGVFTDELNADSTSYEVMVDSTVTFRAVACGTEFSDTVTVVSLAVPSAPLTISDTAIVSCGDSGTVVLSVLSTLAGASYNWYNDSNSIVPAATGDTLLYGLHTAPQNNNTTYSDTLYVSVVDPASGCESERSMVSAVILCTVGLDETASESKLDISMHPNPSKGIFHIVGNNVKEKVEISIYSTNGKLVYQSTNKFSNNFNEKIDISGLAKGLYFIKLQGKQSFGMRKIVIQ